MFTSQTSYLVKITVLCSTAIDVSDASGAWHALGAYGALGAVGPSDVLEASEAPESVPPPPRHDQNAPDRCCKPQYPHWDHVRSVLACVVVVVGRNPASRVGRLQYRVQGCEMKRKSCQSWCARPCNACAIATLSCNVVKSKANAQCCCAKLCNA